MSTCTRCGSVQLVARRVHRYGSLAIFLGYLLLVPAVLVGVLGTMGVVAPRTGAPRVPVTRQELEAAGVPARIADGALAGQRVLDTELDALAAEQRRLVLEAQLRVGNGGARVALERFASGVGFPVVLASAAACGIVGWRLMSKRHLAQCSNCGAFGAAS